MRRMLYLVVLSLVGVFFLSLPKLYSITYTISQTIRVPMVAPTVLSMEIWFWKEKRTLPTPSDNNPLKVIGGEEKSSSPYNFDFSAGLPAGNQCLPGTTSWPDEDDFTIDESKSGNVGFTAHCIGPMGGKTFSVSCGKLKKTEPSGEIPYTIEYRYDSNDPSKSKTINCFGFTCRLDDEGKRYVAGNETSMIAHSESGWSKSWPNEYGHNFSVFNLLFVPPTTAPGTYQTTGDSPYQHLIVSWY